MINFLRYSKIIVSGKELDSDNYNIEFQVDRSSSSDSNGAEITLIYTNKDTFNLFKQDEEIQILAGYKKGIIGLIFNGTIDEIKEESRDTILIIATESNSLFKNYVVNESFTPNTKASLIVKKIIQDSGLTIGRLHIENDYIYSRGKNFIENLKDSLDKLASVTNCEWYEKKGLVYFQPKDYKPKKVYINANSGLLEFNKTTDGYVMTTKLNHTLDEGTIVEITDNKNRKLNVVIETSSHYSDDFTTRCEVYSYDK